MDPLPKARSPSPLSKYTVQGWIKGLKRAATPPPPPPPPPPPFAFRIAGLTVNPSPVSALAVYDACKPNSTLYRVLKAEYAHAWVYRAMPYLHTYIAVSGHICSYSRTQTSMPCTQTRLMKITRKPVFFFTNDSWIAS